MIDASPYVRMSSTRPTLASVIPSTSTSPSSPIVRSALWAAWGDALGFPAELADERMLQRRLDGAPDGQLRPWRRRIGGRMGPTVELPAGCTSDDTQLRLAVGRCVRSSGRFDVEAFSKIELPVFLSYELGAGRGTKAAAHSLGRRSTRWFSNFFQTKSARYVDGGGNGAAMRVQPHVWAAAGAKPDLYLAPMLRDVVCTHGHPRGILGAALHAVALGTTLRQGEIPEPDRWPGMVRFLERIESLVREDDTLGERWLPVWEDGARRSWGTAIGESVSELGRHVQLAAEAAEQVADEPQVDSRERRYLDLTRRLGGLDPRTRGGGSISAVLSLWLAWTHREDPVAGLRLSAELLGSDTDTVATMAGALLGAVALEDPAPPLLDADLISSEARRLEALGHGTRTESFPHPDPLRWQPPGSLADAVGLLDDRPAVAGLGPADPSSDVIAGQGKDPGLWQWLITDYGQHMLVKRRAELKALPESARPRARGTVPQARDVESGNEPLLHASDLRRTEMPDDPEQGVALLVSNDLSPGLAVELLNHYGRMGATPAAVFAALYSERLREQEVRSSPRTSNGAAGRPDVKVRDGH